MNATTKRHFKSGAVAVALLLLASACAPYQLQKAGTNISVGSEIKVDSTIDWNKSKLDAIEYWTADGPDLNILMFMTDIKKKQKLKRVSRPVVNQQAPEEPESKEEIESLTEFDPDMTPIEIIEYVADFIERSFKMQVDVGTIEPHQFADTAGVRFQFDFVQDNGLMGHGVGAGATIEEKLQMIFFMGVEPYYYENYEASVEALLNSVKRDS